MSNFHWSTAGDSPGQDAESPLQLTKAPPTIEKSVIASFKTNSPRHYLTLSSFFSLFFSSFFIFCVKLIFYRYVHKILIGKSCIIIWSKSKMPPPLFPKEQEDRWFIPWSQFTLQPNHMALDLGYFPWQTHLLQTLLWCRQEMYLFNILHTDCCKLNLSHRDSFAYWLQRWKRLDATFGQINACTLNT